VEESMFLDGIFHFLPITNFKNSKLISKRFPLTVNYDKMNHELLIVTQKEIKITDIVNGRVKKIIYGILPNSNEDINLFVIDDIFKHIIMGDNQFLIIYLGVKLKCSKLKMVNLKKCWKDIKDKFNIFL
jgi:hypothetical protein